MQRVLQKCRTKYDGFEEGGTIIQARLLVRTLIEETNIMVVTQTLARIENYGINSLDQVRKTARPMVTAPENDWEDFKALKRFLFEQVYKSPQVCIMNEKGRLILTRIFRHLEQRPEMLPKALFARSGPAGGGEAIRRVIVDYISGMTDRYAMDLYQMMFEPYEKVMFGFRDL